MQQNRNWKLELVVFVFWNFCILFYLYFVPFVFCCICILLHLYFVTNVFWQFIFCSFVFCRVCILEFLNFVMLYLVSFGCILFCLYYGTFVFCHGFINSILVTQPQPNKNITRIFLGRDAFIDYRGLAVFAGERGRT